MPSILITFDITEPTMIDGIWTLSKFRWMAQTTYARFELEDSDGGLINQAYLNTRAAFDKWCDAMPKVQQWHRNLLFSEERLFNSESYRVNAIAYGWFELSDDRTKTENMLSKVNVESIWGIPDLYLVAGFSDGDPIVPPYHALNEDSVLRAVNELTRERRDQRERLDPHTYPFTTDNMRYIVHERHDHGWNRFDPRAVRGTSPADELLAQQREHNRALSELLDAASREEAQRAPVPPAIITLGQPTEVHWTAGNDPASFEQPSPPPRHNRHD